MPLRFSAARSRAQLAVVVPAVLSTFSAIGFAIDFSWQASAGVPSGSWSQAAFWNPAGGPPTAAHTATVNLLLGSPYTVTLDVNPSVASLTLDSTEVTVAGAGRSITATRVDLLNGIFTGTPTLSFGFGTPTLNLGSSFAGGFHTALGFGSRLTFTSANNTISPDRPFSLTVANVGAETVLNGQNGLINQSTISLGGAGSNARIQIPGMFVNQGVINANATNGGEGSNLLSVDLDNSPTGSINCLQNTFLGYGSISMPSTYAHLNRGVINVPIGKVLQVIGSSFEQQSGTMNTDGTLLFAGGSGAGLTSFLQSGGSMVFGATSGGMRLSRNNGSINLQAGTISGNPTLFIDESGVTLTLNTGGSHTGSFSTVVSRSNLTLVADRVAGDRPIELNSSNADANLFGQPGLMNLGTIALTGIRTSRISIPGTLVNQGLISNTMTGGGIGDLALQLDNTVSGTINLAKDTQLGVGSMSEFSTYAHVNRGALTLSAGNTLTLFGSSFEHNSGLMVMSGTLSNGGVGNGVETFLQTGGTIDFGSTGRMQFGFLADCNIVLQAGRFEGTPTINFSVANGTLTITTDDSHTGDFNAFVNNAGLTLAAAKLVAGRTVTVRAANLNGPNGLINQSLITMSSLAPTDQNRFIVPGTLVNEGTITVLTAAVNRIEAQLHNSPTGVVSFQHTASLGGGSYAHINRGSISLAAGKTLFLNGVSFEQAGGAMTIANATINNQNALGPTPIGLFLHTGGVMSLQQSVATFSNLHYNVAGAAPAFGPQSPVVTTLDNSRLHATTLSIGSIGPARLDALNTSTIDFASQIFVGGNGTLNISPNSAADVGNGSASLANTLTVSTNGTLAGSGTVLVGAVQVGAGTVSVGAPVGVLTLSGNYTTAAASTLRLNVTGAAPGTGHDQLSVGGTAQFDGTMTLDIAGSYNPSFFTVHTLAMAASLSGNFDDVLGSQFAPNKILAITYSPNVLGTVALPGDANLDGITDISDFAFLASNFNEIGTWVDGNFNQMGLIDIGDFALLAAFFNVSVPPGAPRSAVPEPTIGIVIAAVAAFRSRRRIGR